MEGAWKDGMMSSPLLNVLQDLGLSCQEDDCKDDCNDHEMHHEQRLRILLIPENKKSNRAVAPNKVNWWRCIPTSHVDE